MALLCLAEAQALTAFRAAAKGSCATVVASLQAGAAELYEKAARTTREHAGHHRITRSTICTTAHSLSIVA
jgi:hypothetical protein